MNVELLVDAEEFWGRMQEDLSEAEQSAYVQTFSFEGDRVGTALGRAMERSPAEDRRLLVDGYSLLYHSDRVIPGPAWFDRSFRREVTLTHRWVRRLQAGGAGVQFSNPLGPSPINLVRRNHKKIAVFDERVAYIGGINFSDHNFEWHDMMFRVECDDVASVLSDDFRSTWDGSSRSFDESVGPFRIVSLNGKGNRARLEPVFEAMNGARETIDVVSAYLSHPFIDYLERAASRGVRVRVLTPEVNNKANLARHVLESAHRGGFEVVRYPGGMSHMKAMMIDEELLITGSSNFDFMSYHILEELVVMTRDRGMVEAFIDRVWTPDIARGEVVPFRSSVRTRTGHAAVRLGAAIASLLALPEEQGV
jgi:cardiolipin synthase A/B